MSGFDDNSYSYTAHQRMLRETWGMDDAMLGKYTRGMLAGMMDFPSDNLDEVAMKGWELGAAGRKKSESLRQKKIEGGKKSAEVRALRNGEVEHNSNTTSTQPPISPENGQHNPDFGSGNTNLGRKEGRKEVIGANAPKQKQTSLSAPSVNTAREIFRQPSAQGQIDLDGLSHVKQPTQAQFVAYAAKRWPKWRSDETAKIYAAWNDARWKDGSGGKIENWVAMLAIYRKRADLNQLGMEYPLGQFVAANMPELAERMRA